MEKVKKIGLKLLYPHIFIFILLFVIGFGSVISVFVLGLDGYWFSYIAYFLSAYAMTISVARSIIKSLKK